jgi:hypothetical protein
VRAAGQHLAGLNRPDVDDGRRPLFGHDAAAEDLGAQPGAAQVHIDEACPLVVGQLQERHDRLDAGVVHQDVDRAEVGRRRLEHPFDVRALRHIALHGDGAAAVGALQGVRGLGGPIEVDVVDGDARPALRQHVGDAAADAAARPGDEGPFSREVSRHTLSDLGRQARNA